MATKANVDRRIQALVDSGRIYWGQPTDRLEDVLRYESSKWTVAVYEEGRIVGESKWGGGPNEDLEYLVATAQMIIYGAAIPFEHIQRLESLLPGVWKRARRFVEANTRSEGSPYYVQTSDLARYFVELSIAGMELPRKLPNDSREWYHVWAWKQCGDVRLAGDCEWFTRYCHHYSQWVQVDWARMRQIPRCERRKVLAALTLFDGDLDAAAEFAANCGSVRETIDRVEAARAFV